MNKENDKGLDDLFKKKLGDPVDETGHREEEDWANLESMLDKHKKRKGIIYWLPVISSVAALLLLVLGWLYFRPQAISHTTQNRPLAANTIKKDKSLNTTGKNGGSNRQPQAQQPTQANAADYAANAPISNITDKGGSTGKTTLSAVGSRRDTTGLLQNNLPDRPPMETFASTGYSGVASPGLSPYSPVSSLSLPQPSASQLASKNDKNKATLRAAGHHTQFAMTVLAAPDLNGVGSFQQSKVGTNFGLLFSAGVFKKLTVSTGVLYSDKPYITAFENYHTPYQFPVNPVNVAANCRMLDIPLNLGYQLYNKHQNKISVGTGLSSYLMLQESYKFNYADSYATGPTSYKVPNSSGYFLGVLNLNATYEHQISSKVGISLQPYIKLPLTNIGYSQVRLQTTGVAIGLNWNIGR